MRLECLPDGRPGPGSGGQQRLAKTRRVGR